MSADGQRTKWCRKIAENFNRLSRAHERYRRTDRWTTTYSERVCVCVCRKLWLLKADSGDVVHGCVCVCVCLCLCVCVCVVVCGCVCVCRKLWLLKAESGDVVHGWPVTVARQLNTAPLVTRLYPLDLTLLVSNTETDRPTHTHRSTHTLTPTHTHRPTHTLTHTHVSIHLT